jgi:antitoxin component HigA of HigAB toxin-antitoxin module
MNLIGKYKLSQFLQHHPELEIAVSAWLLMLEVPDLSNREDTPPTFFKSSHNAFGKFHINFHFNRFNNYGYIIHVGKIQSAIPFAVSKPAIQEPLIEETITIHSDGTRTKEHLSDNIYPIPESEAEKACHKIDLENFGEIHTEAEYKRALYRAIMIFDSKINSQEDTELRYLLPIIIGYENQNFKFKNITFSDVLNLRLEEMGYTAEMLATDLREPTEIIKGFLEGRLQISGTNMKKISKRFRIPRF